MNHSHGFFHCMENEKKFIRSDIFQVKKWPSKIASGGVHKVSFNDEFCLKINNSRFHKGYEAGSEFQHKSVELCFCISGCCKGVFHDNNCFCLKRGQVGVFCSDYPLRKISIEPGIDYRAVIIQVEPLVIKKWFGEKSELFLNFSGKNKKELNINLVEKINFSMGKILDEMINFPVGDNALKLYLESKSMEIVSIVLNNIYFDKDSDFSGRHKKRIKEARDILVNDLENPPSLKKICRITGLNKNLLNKGFKEVYGSSVFDYLRDFRLEKAKEWLEREGLETGVTEIGFRAGYLNPASFSRAFSRKFGASPKTFISK